jgi:predicted permease
MKPLSPLERLLHRLRRNPAADLKEEIGFHLEMRVQDNIAAGMSPVEARVQAERQFGNVGAVSKECLSIEEKIVRREARSEWFTALLRDLRIAARMLGRAPAYALSAILTLALGVGGVTTIMSVLSSVVLNPLPFPESDDLVRIQSVKRGDLPWNGVSIPDALDWMERGTSMTGIGLVQSGLGMNLTVADQTVHLSAASLSQGMLPLLGIAPQLGQPFSESDFQPGAAPAVLLSDGLWQREFGGDRRVIGTTTVINGRPFTIRGVMPREFRFPDRTTEMWLPLPIIPGQGYATANGRWARIFPAYGRLRPGVDVTRAQADMAALARQMEAEHPGPDGGMGVSVRPLKAVVLGTTGRTLWIVLGAAGFVLLIACINVLNLGLVRLVTRAREISVRLAHGATRGHLARQFMAESLILVSLGALAGATLAWSAIRGFATWGPHSLPRIEEVAVNGTTLVVTLGVALLIAVALGLAPLFSSAGLVSGSARAGTRETESRHQGRLRSLFVVGEVALAVVLLASAGLLFASFLRLTSVDTGFNSERVVTLKMSPRGLNYRSSPLALPQLYDQTLESVRRIPGITSAALIGDLPLTGGGTGWTFVPEGVAVEAGQEPSATVLPASDDYFTTLDVPLLRGRGFQRRDFDGQGDEIIINLALAERVYGNEDPVGRRLALGSVGSVNPSLTIVGVVGNMRSASLAEPPRPEIYQPYAPKTLSGDMTLVVRSTAEPEDAVRLVAAAVREIDRTIPVSQVRTLDEVLNESVAGQQFTALLIGMFAGLAVLMAIVGILGILAQSVIQESRAIAVRMALGARPGQIVSRVFRRGMRLTLGGLAIGLLATLATTRVLTTLLYGVTPTDPLVIGLVVALFLLTAALACMLPAVRAARANPIRALRGD